MKELFIKPIIELIEINNDEIICSSGDPFTSDPGYGPNDATNIPWPF